MSLNLSGSDNGGILSYLVGIKDLKAGVIRTPLPSKETFLDDPLRVMRAVRFGESLRASLNSYLIQNVLISMTVNHKSEILLLSLH